MGQTVAVLLAAYNGEKYLDKQLDSLFHQSFQDFTLHVRDDASTDRTVGILSEYQKRYPGRIVLTQTENNSGSAKYNFMQLITSTKGDYVFLCDQDDIWIHDKMEKSLSKMKELEQHYGKNTPLLVHSDLTVTDEELNVTAPSYRKQVLHPDWELFDFAQSLVMNIATGSTILYNYALAKLLAETPCFFVMHDWWLLQTALAFGKVGHIYEPLVLYRQHGGNELGSSNVASFRYKLWRLLHGGSVKKRFQDSFKQAGVFLHMYGDKLNPTQRTLLQHYRGIAGLGKIDRIRAIFKLGVIHYGFSRKIATILFI